MNDTNVTVRCLNDLHIPLKTFIEPQKPLYCVFTACDTEPRIV